MHPVLQIDDIQHLIFERLQPRDLARLARTCGAFFECASHELSKTINSFAPLLSCLPPDYRNRPLQAEDLHRLDLYASKVQNLVLGTESVQKIPLQFQPKNQSKMNPEKSWKELWQEIASLRPTSEFLPNLRRLRINNVTEELLIPLIGISGSKLNQIYIKFVRYKQCQNIVRQILDRLQETPNLENLFVRDDDVPSKLIQKAPLKRLRLDPCKDAKSHQEFHPNRFSLRPEILQISTLETLTIWLTRNWYSPGIKISKNRYLPALKTLWLNLTTFRPEADRWIVGGGQQPPTVFFKGLDNPELSLLNIKFHYETTGRMFLAVVSAANNSCRLKNLSELALASEVWCNNRSERCGMRPAPNINSTDLREGLRMLLPLPKLKLLRLSVAPNFLDVLNVKLYKSITGGLPALEKLWLSHAEFAASSFHRIIYYERTPLHHLAAFCSMLPNLVEVSIGTVDGLTLEKKSHKKWACLGVKSLTIHHWAGSTSDMEPAVSRELLHLGLRTYFPNSDLA